MSIKTTTQCPTLCLCGNGYYVDRYRNNSKACPACDPELGETAEIRIESYRKLLTYPVHK